MRHVGSRTVAGAILAMIVWTAGEAGAQAPVTPAQEPLAGSRVFGAKGCVRCHSVNGLGGKVGPDLGRIPRPRSFYDLASAMWNHLPAMLERMQQLGVSRPRLDPRELGDLVAFLYTAGYFEPPGDPTVGRGLFTDKRCVVCHQVRGVGGVVGPNLDALAASASPMFVAAALWNHGPAMAQAMRARGIERPTFRGHELLDLVAYLRAASSGPPVEQPLHVLPGRAEAGRRLFRDKRCIECHRVGGEGGRVGPDLAERGAGRTLTEFAAAMWNKAPAMTAAMAERRIAVPQLTAGEMADLVAYLDSVRYFGVRADPARGRALVGRKGCLACHGRGAAAGRAGPDLAKVEGLDSPAAVVAALWNHAFIMGVRGEPGAAVPWPRLSPEEMADVVVFLARPAGRR